MTVFSQVKQNNWPSSSNQGEDFAIVRFPFNSLTGLADIPAKVGSRTLRQAISVTLGGNASISSTQSQFYGTSAFFDGSGDFLTLSGLPTNYLSTDFTIEGWIYLNAQANQMFFNTIPHTSLGVSLDRDATGRTSLYIGNGSSWLTSDFRSSGSLSRFTWHHLAIVRSSSVITIYHNGVAQGSTSANMPTGYGTTAYIGTFNGSTGENMNAYVNDYRIHSYAKYTSSFTPPGQMFYQG